MSRIYIVLDFKLIVTLYFMEMPISKLADNELKTVFLIIRSQ